MRHVRCLKVDCGEMAGDRQDNLRTKFSVLNVNFSSYSPDFLGLRRPAHADVKLGYPSKKRLFIRCCYA